MSKLIASILLWLARKAVMLALILAVLLLGVRMKTEWSELSRKLSELDKKEQIAKSLHEDLKRLETQIKEKTPEIQKMVKEFADIEKLSSEALAAASRAKANKDYWDSQVHFYTIWPFFSETLAKQKMADADYQGKQWASDQAQKARNALKDKFTSSTSEQLIRSKAQTEQSIRNMEGLIASDKESIEKNPRQRVIAAARAQLPVALGVLIGIILAPLLIKAVFYFVFAPLAAKMPPIRVLTPSGSEARPSVVPSAVSLSIELEPGQEMLVHSDYLQSSGVPAKKHTQWFLNPRIPISSIASGLVILTGIRPSGSQNTKVVVSAQTDALGEVGIIELPEGSAMVIQPRSLVGVVKPQRESVRITRHWRLGSLHSWLTLQLRFLVFHGPCQLILKGCRGIVAEAPDSASGRMINQDATIGFSANLEYRNTRCETFTSYFRGKEALFNDQFSGSPGLFVYEEMPASDRKTGITGRGMEGVVDAALKVFGI